MPALVAVINRLLDPGVVIDPTGWRPSAPAPNVATRWLRVPAVSSTIGTLAEPVRLRASFPFRYSLRYAGLFRVTLKQLDLWRFLAYADDYETLVHDTGFRRVVPALFRLQDLELTDPNAFSGGLPPEIFRLYPTNVHAILPRNTRAKSVEWQLIGTGLNPDGSDADGIGIGHAYVGQAIDIRYGRGRSDDINPTDQRARSPAGLLTVEPGISFRSASLPLDHLPRDVARDLWDAYQLAQTSRLVVYLPESSGPLWAQEAFRNGFLGTFVGRHSQQRAFHRFSRSALSVEEWTS